jgi:pimeloyl-ACP methyl ester carboxylesterase
MGKADPAQPGTPLNHPQPCEEIAFDIRVDGLRLHAKSILPPGAAKAGNHPTLVFLHEGLGSITQWKHFPLALARATGLPALVYDRCGYGKSESRTRPMDPSYLEVEAWERLPQVLATCGIESPLLVGHSDGATIALLYAAKFPASPLGVISEAAHVLIEPISLQGIWRTLRAFETTNLRDRLRTHHGAKVDAVFHGWSDVWLSPGFRDWSMVGLLPGIRCPVLAIQGEDDEYGTPAQVSAITGGVSGPASALLIPGCGHVPHFQAGERVLDGMSRFIGTLVDAAQHGNGATP